MVRQGCTFRAAAGDSATIVVGDIPIVVVRKRIKHMHLRVRPPEGHVTISAPRAVSRHVVEAFAVGRLEWIRRQQDRVRGQAREATRHYVTGEIHSLWGRQHLLHVEESRGGQGVRLGDDCITLFVSSDSDSGRRAHVMCAWHKSILHETLPPLIRTWEQRLGVQVKAYHLRRMISRWGSCNHRTAHIRLNTELVTKPSHLLEYVLVHEMVHLIVPNHGRRFVAVMNEHYPSWREARTELNESWSRGGVTGDEK